MKDWTPKIGDYVTPDPSTELGTMLSSEVGNTFRVINVVKGSIVLDRAPYGFIKYGWTIEYWMPAKRQMVKEIIKDL